MKPNHIPYIAPINIEEDRLSGFLKEITLIPHAFGHQCYDSAAICDDRIIGDFELIYIVDGESRITIGKKEYACGRGDIILIPPFTVHRIQTGKSRPHNNYWLHFDVYPLYRNEDFLHAMLAGENEHRIHLGLLNQMAEIYGKIEEEIETGRPGNAAFIHSLLTQIVITVLRKNAGIIPATMKYAKSDPEMSVVNQCLEYIKNNVGESIRVRDLAGLAHVSDSYLFKAFSRVMKIPPNKYIQLYKVKSAEQLMKTSSRSIKEISGMLGFSSPFYFSRIFKQYYGCSPRDYMKDKTILQQSGLNANH